MAQQRLTDEVCQQAVKLLELHGSKIAAARASGIPRPTLQHRLHVAAERGMMGFKPVLPGYHLKQTAAQLGPDGEVQKEWVKQTKEHGEEFELPDGHIVKGVSALTDPEGRVIHQWIKTKRDSVVPDLVRALKVEFDDYRKRVKLIPAPRRVESGLLSVYPIADPHIGQLSWKPETGENYDTKIASDRLRDCTSRLVAQSPPSKEAIILNLGDFQHSDDAKNKTPASGNILDVDGRYFKLLRTCVRLHQDVIDLALQKHERVRVRCLPGNHDPHASIAMTIALAAYYERDKRVTVIDDPSEYFYHRFGATLIGAHHGHRRRAADLAMNMAVVRRQDWGATKYHWFMFGHIHHESAREVGDVRVESFQTIAAKDAWSAANGYSSGKSLVAITLDRVQGEIGRHRVNIPPPGM